MRQTLADILLALARKTAPRATIKNPSNYYVEWSN